MGILAAKKHKRRKMGAEFLTTDEHGFLQKVTEEIKGKP